ncbi:RHS repeat-associated protein [Filimonas zeae]|nr:RHS repeat-associated core domain-containing protein [Filimonas zeae]MDR6340041.1 RHS repeat-associated protein [Filimonas zeae]
MTINQYLFFKHRLRLACCLFCLLLAGIGQPLRAQEWGVAKSPQIVTLTGAGLAANAPLLQQYTGVEKHSTRNLVMLSLIEETNAYIPDNFTVSVNVEVTYKDGSGNNILLPAKTLAVSYSKASGTQFNAKSYLSFENLDYVNVVVKSVTPSPATLSNGVSVLSLVRLDNEMRVTSYYNLVTTNKPKFESFTESSGELKVEWSIPLNTGENGSQLEWTWLENQFEDSYKKNGVLDSSLVFRNNATRIDLPVNTLKYAIPLLYNGVGKLFYRVRAVNNKAGRREDGAWSFVKTHSYNGHGDSLNWQATTSFAEEGKRKSVVQYYDGSLRGRQTVTKDNVNNNVISAETFYDGAGRPAVQILPVPGINKAIAYTRNLNLFNNQSESKDPAELFDLTTGSTPSSVTPGLNAAASAASKYYSVLNTTGSRQLPDAEEYPYTVTRYTPDNTGRIQAQSGVGKAFRMGSGHETKYYYGTPAQEELDGLFGTEAGIFSHYFKNMVRDANGQMSVSYVDMHGRTVATALAGEAPENTTALNLTQADYPNQAGTLITRNLLNAATNTVKNNSVESVNSILVPAAGNYNFSYNLSPQSLLLAACPVYGSTPLSYDCMYNLEIAITDESGDAPPVIRTFNNIQATLDDNPNTTAPGLVNIAFMQRLEPGSYSIRKTLTLSDSTMRKYQALYLQKALCKNEQQLIDSVFAVMQNISGCNVSKPAVTCQACLDSLGTFTQYKQKYIREYDGALPSDSLIRVAYSSDSASCRQLCANVSQKLNIIRSIMLSDMIPYSGQYAVKNQPAGPDVSMYNRYNIFSSVGKPQPFYKLPVNAQGDSSFYMDVAGVRDNTIHPNANARYTLLATMPDSVFAERFTYSWANALLYYHPEYPKLRKAEEFLKPAYDWIDEFNSITSYDIAVNRGFALNAASFGTIATDPFFRVVNTGKSKAAMNQKVTDRGYYTGSLWQSAYSAIMCSSYTDTAGRNSCFRNAGVAPTMTTLTSAEKDAVWSTFKGLYSAVRDSMVNVWLDSAAPVTNAATLIHEKYTLRFASESNLVLQNNWQSWLPATHGAAPAINLQDSVKKFYNSQCEGYIEQWKAHLLQSKAVNALTLTNQQAFLKEVTDSMLMVCQRGTDAANPYGASTVAPGTPNDGAARSFEAVIKKALLKYGITTPDLFGNPYSIDYPRAYGQGPVITKTYTTTVDTCTCNMFQKLLQANGNPSTLKALNDSLRKKNYGDTISVALYAGLQHCGQLKSTCPECPSCRVDPTAAAAVPGNGCRDTSIAYPLGGQVPLPEFLKCGYLKTASCVTCGELQALKTEFQNYFTTAPYKDAPYVTGDIDSTKAACNELFARFVNYRTGFEYKWREYAGAAKAAPCPLAASGDFDVTATVICRATLPLNDTAGVFLPQSPCQQTLNQATAMAATIYAARTEKLLADFEAAYRARCLATRTQEQFTVADTVKEYHYTLYYYDMAGNLVKTVPPKGVKPDFSAAAVSRIATARAAGTKKVPGHTFVTRYNYNSLNQVVTQKTPDAGKSAFWYDRLGRLAVSQNAQQFYTGNQYSYTRYDSLGRITEVGQKVNATAMSQSTSQNAVALENWLITTGGTRSQITGTVYDLDQTASNAYLSSYLQNQHNLRNRVSYTYTRKLSTDVADYNATYYSYDVHGNVDTLLQNYSGVYDNNADGYKLIAYQYDLISGKVNGVQYQPKRSDAFYHRYEYDAENRITEVFTSRDSLIWDREAAYQYYEHGPLARTILGQQQVQGVDYTYTLQGWLKGINNNVSATGCIGGTAPESLVVSSRIINQPPQYVARGTIEFTEGFESPDNDEFDTHLDASLAVCRSGGNAGGLLSEAEPATVAGDAYGFSLHYYPGDYRAIAAPSGATGILDALGANASPLYNGNIAAMAVSVPQLGDAKVYNYRYDQLNRLLRMNVFNGLNTATGTFSPISTEDYKEHIAYDPNSNITSYLRNGYRTSSGQTENMDKLRYNYGSGTNRLNYVYDSVPTTTLYTTDLESQAAGNYAYDSIGNLVKDVSAGLDNIQWTVYGKIDNIKKGNNFIYYSYDAAGNRVSKIADGKTTLYVRDASGNVMAVYEKAGTGAFLQTETHLYGSSRLGLQKQLTVAKQEIPMAGGIAYGALRTFTRGEKLFELSNHLGNVLATVSDRRVQVGSGSTLSSYTADVVSAQDYYPFGMLQPGRSYNAGGYRYGFNGKENDNEVKGEGNNVDFGARIYDSRVGRWFSVDKIIKPAFSSYQFAKGNPANYIDPDGNDEIHFYYNIQDNLDASGKSFTTITISTQIIENGDRNHTFFVHNQALGGLVDGVQIKPFMKGTNLPNQSSFNASENKLPLASVTKYLFGLGRNQTDDYEYLGSLLQVDPTILEHYKGDNQWSMAFNGARAQSKTAEIGKKLVGVSETVFALIDGYYALKGLTPVWSLIGGGYKTAGFGSFEAIKSGKFIGEFGKCVEYAKAFIQDFGKIIKKAGGNAEVFEMNIGKDNYIGFPRQSLSDNGLHRYIEVTVGEEVRIYDNFHPNGILKADYMRDVEGFIFTSKGQVRVSGEELMKNAKKVN